jgi:hypothetical protein
LSDERDLGVVEHLTRRTVLKALGGAAAGVAMAPAAAAKVAQGRSPGSDARELSTPLHFSSATALARAIRTRRLSAEEVARFLEREFGGFVAPDI